MLSRHGLLFQKVSTDSKKSYISEKKADCDCGILRLAFEQILLKVPGSIYVSFPHAVLQNYDGHKCDAIDIRLRLW